MELLGSITGAQARENAATADDGDPGIGRPRALEPVRVLPGAYRVRAERSWCGPSSPLVADRFVEPDAGRRYDRDAVASESIEADAGLSARRVPDEHHARTGDRVLAVELEHD